MFDALTTLPFGKSLCISDLLTEDPNDYLDGDGHQKAIISYPWLSSEEITRAVDEILKDYYMTPSYIPLALNYVFRRHGFEEERRLWYSAKMFMGYVKEKGWGEYTASVNGGCL